MLGMVREIVQEMQQCLKCVDAEGAEDCTSSSEGPALGPGLVRSFILKPVRLQLMQSQSVSLQGFLKSGYPLQLC